MAQVISGQLSQPVVIEIVELPSERIEPEEEEENDIMHTIDIVLDDADVSAYRIILATALYLVKKDISILNFNNNFGLCQLQENIPSGTQNSNEVALQPEVTPDSTTQSTSTDEKKKDGAFKRGTKTERVCELLASVMRCEFSCGFGF